MAKDPVCGMEVNEKESKNKTNYQGQEYHFCSPGCKDKFTQNPSQFAGQNQPQGQGQQRQQPQGQRQQPQGQQGQHKEGQKKFGT